MTSSGTEQNLLEDISALRVVIITHDDPFFLGKCFDYLCSKLPARIELVACVINRALPFGKNDSFLAKAFRTTRIFGVRFFVRYPPDLADEAVQTILAKAEVLLREMA